MCYDNVKWKKYLHFSSTLRKQDKRKRNRGKNDKLVIMESKMPNAKMIRDGLELREKAKLQLGRTYFNEEYKKTK